MVRRILRRIVHRELSRFNLRRLLVSANMYTHERSQNFNITEYLWRLKALRGLSVEIFRCTRSPLQISRLRINGIMCMGNESGMSPLRERRRNLFSDERNIVSVAKRKRKCIFRLLKKIRESLLFLIFFFLFVVHRT